MFRFDVYGVSLRVRDSVEVSIVAIFMERRHSIEVPPSSAQYDLVILPRASGTSPRNVAGRLCGSDGRVREEGFMSMSRERRAS